MVRLGQKLSEVRVSKKLTIEEVARQTKIRASFISAIEKGEYAKLPSSVYVQGFVKNYIEFLELPTKPLLALFRREFNEQEFLGVLPESFTTKQESVFPRVRFTRTIFLIFVVLLGLGGFLFWQFKAAFFPPSLTILSPIENQTLSTQVIHVVGKTTQNTAVTINGMSASVTDTGEFTKDIQVFSGKVTLLITATNSFNKKVVIERHVFVRVPSS